MTVVRLFLKYSMGVIYALTAAIFLYFPIAEMAGHIARETRFFMIPGIFPIEDALLPLLCLAVAYAVIAKLRRIVDAPPAVEEAAASPEDD